MNVKDIKKQLRDIEQSYSKQFEQVSDFIFKNPELSEQEYISSTYLMECINQHGFVVESHYAGIDTAFRGEFTLGTGKGPTIAFLAEYDALPVQLGSDYSNNNREGVIKAAHTCGHNWIAATTTGASIAMSKLEGLDGRIVLIGTPAEETIGSKVDMVKFGVFDDIDIVIQPHLEGFTDINCTALALDAIEFKFFGKSTHAASYPYKGINALDAVQLMFSGVNALRQQLMDDVKISGIVTSGGQASNIIPDFASCRFTVRSQNRGYLNEVTKKVINCAKGAELMTGAYMEYSFFENQTDDILNVDLLRKVLKENMIEEGIINIRDNEVMPTGSSDIGNVSQICPTMYFEIDIESEEPFYTHDLIALEYVNSQQSYKKLHQTINIISNLAIDLISNQGLVEDIKLRHMELRQLYSIQ